MKSVVIFGAGMSASSLIKYFKEQINHNDWDVLVCDTNEDLLKAKVGSQPKMNYTICDVHNAEERENIIKGKDLVISFLPARFHMLVVEDCLKFKINCITPSYVSPEMQAKDEEAKEKGVLLLNELGVDPGIDHMSAMKIIDEIKEQGGELHIFESFTGGLVAPESDNNPWNYKFTWNPRNVVLAGQGGAAKFIQEGKYKYIPYNKLFRRTEFIKIQDLGWFEGYANRDSLKYRDTYDLKNIPTIYRGTLRRKGFSRAWDCFVQLGATDDSYVLEGSKDMTHRDFINSFLPYNPNDSVELKLRHYLNIRQDDSIWDKLVWLDIFSDDKVIGIDNATPAQCLQKILVDKWSLDPEDKDMIAMWHKFVYKVKGEFKEINSSMIYVGQDSVYTAMSDTVGLPVAIASKLVLEGKIKDVGVKIPIHKNIYEPILKELENYGIKFLDEEINPPVLYSES